MTVALVADVNESETLWRMTDSGTTLADLALPCLAVIGSENVEIEGFSNPGPRAGVYHVFVQRRRNNTDATAHSAGATLAPATLGTGGGSSVPDPSGAPDGQVLTTESGAYALGIGDVQTVVRTLTAVEVADLANNPVELVAGTAGTILWPISAAVLSQPAGLGFSGASGALQIVNGNGVLAVLSTSLTVPNELLSDVPVWAILAPIANLRDTPPTGESLVVLITSTSPTADVGSTLDVIVVYRRVDVP